MKVGIAFKYTNRKLVTDRKEVLQIWEDYFKTLLNPREDRDLDLPGRSNGEDQGW